MRRKPRLLLLADAFDNRGGGEVVVAHLANALRARWDVAVLTTTRGSDEVVRHEDLLELRIHSAYHPRLRPLVSLVNPLVTPKVGAIVRRFRPDVVHAWNVHGHLSYDALRLVRHAGVPIVLTYQDAQPFCYSKFRCWIDPPPHRRLPHGQFWPFWPFWPRGYPILTPPPAPLLPLSARPEPRGCADTDARPDYRADPRTCRSCRQHYWLFPPRNRLVRSYLRRFVSHGVSVSDALADALAANDVSADSVVHNGLPLDDSALVGADGARARARHGWAEEPLLTTGGRLHFFKGQRLAVEAFAAVAASHPTARLVVLGDRGWFRDSLAEQARDLGVAERVSFPGFLERPAYYDCLAASDAFLNLSMYLDPFPTVNLEAMALGAPVIGTCFGGTPEAVVDGETGFVVNPYDLEQVKARALALLRDAGCRRRMGQAGRQRVERDFPVERMAARYESIYHDLSASKTRVRA
jgi:glycosyltransferase involved in cell wall biosynthesis